MLPLVGDTPPSSARRRRNSGSATICATFWFSRATTAGWGVGAGHQAEPHVEVRMQRRSDTRAHLSREEPDRWAGMIREPAVEQCSQLRMKSDALNVTTESILITKFAMASASLVSTSMKV